jgi:hypothetical protein
LNLTAEKGFAIEQALAAMKEQQLVTGQSSWRVAIVGPGLDFADKNSGHDFCPLQTLQPFTLIDSVVHLKLAALPQTIEVTTFDISRRVIDHINSLHERGKDGKPYEIRLPFESGSPWTVELRSYWQAAGNQVGTEVSVPKPPSIGKQLSERGIRVRPQIAAKVSAVDFNVVTQRWNGQPFDLIVATNVLAYYDKLDQALAFSGIEAMLRPGGLFLTNNVVIELPFSRLRATGLVRVEYSRKLAWTDHIFWYVRQ